MTIAKQILNLLGAPFQTPLQQTDIAYRLGANAPTVRRTVQELRRLNQVHNADYAGVYGFPRLKIGPRP